MPSNEPAVSTISYPSTSKPTRPKRERAHHQHGSFSSCPPTPKLGRPTYICSFCTSKGSQLSTCVGPRERPCQPVLSVHCPTTRLRVRHHLVSWSHPRQSVTPLRPFFPPVACYRPRLTEGTRHRGPVLVGAHELLRSFSRCWEESRSRTG